jgi:hypothetical protein
MADALHNQFNQSTYFFNVTQPANKQNSLLSEFFQPLAIVAFNLDGWILTYYLLLYFYYGLP